MVQAAAKIGGLFGNMKGVAPAPSAFTDFRADEIVFDGTAGNQPRIVTEACKLSVPSGLTARKLAGYVFGVFSGAGVVIGRVNFFFRGNNVGNVPVFATQNNPLREGLYSPLVSGGAAQSDCVLIQPPYPPLTGEPNATLLQSLQINGEIDTVTADITFLQNVTALRMIICCTSHLP